MILYELTGHNEDHPIYKTLEVSNGIRHYSFLQSIIEASLSIKKHFLSQTLLKAINYHAIACLHTNAGEYRPCEVKAGDYKPPQHYLVNDLMDDFVNEVNWKWESANPIALASYVLWKLNHIHPFINGNGRTARAACYFVLCVKTGGWLGGDIILPELLRLNRDKYVNALKTLDGKALDFENEVNIHDPLQDLIVELLTQQMQPQSPPNP